MKKIVKIFCFSSILTVVIIVTFKILWLRDNVYSSEVFGEFYKLPDNSVDVILVGSSGIREYYIAPEAYIHNGISSYALATGNQPIGATKYVIQEAEKTQNPKLYIVDIRQLIHDGYDDGAIRRVADAMKFSSNRIYMLNDLLEYYEEINPDITVDKFDYYFSFSTYHSRWEDVGKDDFITSENEWMGYNIYNGIEPFEPLSIDTLQNSEVPISAHNEEVLNELLNYCETLDAEVLFVNVPSLYDANSFGMFNYSKNIIEKRGFKCLDLNYYTNEMGIDYSSDFKNYYHVNVWGALKVTDFLSDYVIQNYGIESHIKDALYSVWKENYNAFSKNLLIKTNTINKYLEILKKYDDKVIIMSVKDEASSNLTDESKHLLKNLGIQREIDLQTGFIAVLNGDIIYEDSGNSIAYNTVINGHNIVVLSQGYNNGNTSQIIIDGIDYSMNQRGINIVVWDSETGNIIDSIVFDTCGDNLATR